MGGKTVSRLSPVERIFCSLALLVFLAACQVPPDVDRRPTAVTQAATSLPQLSPTFPLASTDTPRPSSSPTASPPRYTASPTRTPPDPLISISNASALTETAQIRFDPWELVLALAWSPDGSRLAIAAGENIQLYDAGQLTRLDTLPISAFTYSLAFSPDGNWLAAGSRDGLVRLWDLAAGPASQPRYSLDAHKKGVNSLAFSPDGRWLASGGNDAVAKIWDVGTGTLVQTIIGGTFAVPGIAFEPGSGMLAILNGQVLRLREAESGRLAGTLRVDAPLYCLAFSPNGRYLALGDSDNTIRYWETSSMIGADIETPPPQGTLVGHSGAKGSPSALIWSLVFSPDSSLLASAGGDGVTRLWDLASGHPAGALATQSRPVTSVAFSPDGRRLATGSLDGTVRFWSAKP